MLTRDHEDVRWCRVIFGTLILHLLVSFFLVNVEFGNNKSFPIPVVIRGVSFFYMVDFGE